MAVLIAQVLVGCTDPKQPTQPEKEIVIGVIAPLTGAKADQGKQFKEGAQIRVDEINEAGGLLGRKIRLEILDDEGQPANAATCAQRLVANPEVVAVVGPSSTASCNAAIPILETAKICGISPSASTATLSTDNPYFFILQQPNILDAPKLTKLARDKFGATKIGMITLRDDWGQSVASAGKASLPELGLVLSAEVEYAQGDRDFKSQITSLMESEPDVVIFNTHYTEGALAARQAREAGVTVPFLGQITTVYDEFLDIFGLDEGFIAQTPFLATLDDPKVQAAVAKFEPLIGRLPQQYHVFTYDAVSAIADAIVGVGNTSDKEAIRDAIAGLDDMDGVAFKWGFDENELVKLDNFFVQVQDGKWTLLK